MNNTLQQMENSLKNQMYTVFKNCGYENGLVFIKNELLDLDGVTEHQKDAFLVATFDALDNGNTIFNNAIARASGAYFRDYGNYAKDDGQYYTTVVEYNELMEAIKFIRTQIH